MACEAIKRTVTFARKELESHRKLPGNDLIQCRFLKDALRPLVGTRGRWCRILVRGAGGGTKGAVLPFGGGAGQIRGKFSHGVYEKEGGGGSQVQT